MDDDRKKLLRRLSTLATELMEDAHEAAIVSIAAADPGAPPPVGRSWESFSFESGHSIH